MILNNFQLKLSRVKRLLILIVIWSWFSGLSGNENGNQSSTQLKLFYITDQQLSNRAVIDLNGNVVESYDYYPFGMPMPGRVVVSDSRTVNGFLGREFDLESGWLYFDAGYYDALVARWLSPQSAAFAAGGSPYHFAISGRSNASSSGNPAAVNRSSFQPISPALPVNQQPGSAGSPDRSSLGPADEFSYHITRANRAPRYLNLDDQVQHQQLKVDENPFNHSDHLAKHKILTLLGRQISAVFILDSERERLCCRRQKHRKSGKDVSNDKSSFIPRSNSKYRLRAAKNPGKKAAKIFDTILNHSGSPASGVFQAQISIARMVISLSDERQSKH